MKSAIPKSSKVRHIARPFGWGKVSDVHLATPTFSEEKTTCNPAEYPSFKKLGPNKNLLVGKFAKLLSEMFALHSCSCRGPKKNWPNCAFFGGGGGCPQKKNSTSKQKKNTTTPPTGPVVKGELGLLIRCIMSNFQACNMTKSSCPSCWELAERWFLPTQKEGLFHYQILAPNKIRIPSRENLYQIPT